jgi:hypothetical protein
MKALAIFTVAAMVAFFDPAKVGAKTGPLILTASGTIALGAINASSTSTKTNIYTVSTLSFNEKYIYNMVSNAAASTSYPSLTPTHLPADGYIAFDPNGSDLQENVFEEDYYAQGLFYVTNKSGFYFPLSGFDTTNGYYSYIELDNDDFGFYNNFYGEFSGSEPTKTLAGTYTETEASVFYVHSNPYAFDDGDEPSVVFNNVNAIEIHSAMKASWQYFGAEQLTNNSDASIGSGNGSAQINNNEGATVTSGKVSLSP